MATPLGQAIAELIALRGLANKQGDAQLRDAWNKVAHEFADRTVVIGVKRKVLQIGVRSSALLSELVAFHQQRLLKSFQKAHPDLGIKKLKFELRTKVE